MKKNRFGERVIGVSFRLEESIVSMIKTLSLLSKKDATEIIRELVQRAHKEAMEANNGKKES
jgi:hypothetical protein